MWWRKTKVQEEMLQGEIRPNPRGACLAFLLIPLFCVLTGCGFQPIYGSHDNAGPVAEALNQVAIDNIPDHPGQMLRNDLIDRMYGKGRPGQPLYRLHVSLRSNEEDLGLLQNSTAVFADLTTIGDFVLSDAHGNKLLSGTSRSVTSYDQLSNQYGTLAAHDSAVERTIHEVSEQIVNRLSLYFAQRDEQKPAEPQ